MRFVRNTGDAPSNKKKRLVFREEYRRHSQQQQELAFREEYRRRSAFREEYRRGNNTIKKRRFALCEEYRRRNRQQQGFPEQGNNDEELRQRETFKPDREVQFPENFRTRGTERILLCTWRPWFWKQVQQDCGEDSRILQGGS